MTRTQNILEFSARLQRSRWGLWVACAIGSVVCVALSILIPNSFWPAYLISWLFLLGIGLGCLCLTLLHQLTSGQWGLEIARHLVAGAATLPLSTLLALPLGGGVHWIYVWFEPASAREMLNRHQQAYFAEWAWGLRLFVYFAAWNTLSWLMLSRYRQLCQSGDLQKWCATPRGSAIGLISLGILTTFFTIDCVMSLEPRWTSTIFPALLSMGFVVSGMAFAMLSRQLPLLQVRFPADAKPARDRALDLGNLLLATLLMWVYFGASQFLIIWSGDLPIETAWYQRRLEGIWPGFAFALVVFHFAVPFACLLSRDVKTNRGAMIFVTTDLLVMRFVDLVWTVIPDCRTEGMWWLLCLPVAFVTLGSAWVAVFLRYQERLPLLVVNDLASIPSTTTEVVSI